MDMQIGMALEQIRQANQNLEQRLAMDVQFVEATNEGINPGNDRTLPVLQAITGQDFGVDPEKWKSWWTDQLGYAYQSDMPETKPTYTDVDHRLLHYAARIQPASPPALWSTRSTARGRSNRSGSAIGCCRKTLRPARSHFSRWWPRIAISRRGRCGSQ